MSEMKLLRVSKGCLPSPACGKKAVTSSRSLHLSPLAGEVGSRSCAIWVREASPAVGKRSGMMCQCDCPAHKRQGMTHTRLRFKPGELIVRCLTACGKNHGMSCRRSRHCRRTGFDRRHASGGMAHKTGEDRHRDGRS